MNLQNRTPFAVLWIPGRMKYPDHSLTLIVKGTFDLRPGESAVASEKQLPIVHDLPHPDDDKAGPYYDSDLAYFKPRADYLLVGRCYAPGGRPTSETTVTFTVGNWGRRLRVIGNREWKRGMLKAGHTDPSPFTEMDLNWSRAYGGPRFAPNLVGRGYHRGSPENDLERALPNIEDPKQPIRSPSDPIAPAGFCPIDRTWAPRKRMIGTYGKKWFKTRSPWVPEDVDWTVSNGAPAANQAVGYLQGDEQVHLENLNRSSPNFTGLLPEVRVRALVDRRAPAGTEVEEVPLLLDTLWIDAERLQAVVVWRGVCTVASEEFEDLDTLLVGSEPLGAKTPMREFWRSRVETSSPEPPSDSLFATAVPSEDEGSTPRGDRGDVGTDAPPEEDEPLLTPEQADALAKLPPPEEMLASFRKRLAELPEGAAVDPLAFDERSLLLAAIELLEQGNTAEPEIVPWTRESVLDALETGATLDEAELQGLDLSDIDFKQVGLRGVNLRKSSLARTNLAECDLSGARLDDCEAPEANLTGANLSGASLQRAKLVKASLKGARLDRADFRESVLDDASLDEAGGTKTDMSGAHLDHCSFAGSDLRDGNFSHVRGTRIHFEGARLDGSSFEDAVVRESYLQGASCDKLRGSRSDFSFSDLSDASFSAADLSQARLQSVRGDRASFVRADLADAQLGESDFDESDFSRASLLGADLTAASLRRAILRRARLERTVLANANLFEAMLPAAQLIGTDFRGANLFGADLSDIEGRGVHFEGANLKRTRLDRDG
jgi:uncharacterized protein YjbI with pentapeptide repeats